MTTRAKGYRAAAEGYRRGLQDMANRGTLTLPSARSFAHDARKLYGDWATVGHEIAKAVRIIGQERCTEAPKPNEDGAGLNARPGRRTR